MNTTARTAHDGQHANEVADSRIPLNRSAPSVDVGGTCARRRRPFAGSRSVRLGLLAACAVALISTGCASTPSSQRTAAGEPAPVAADVAMQRLMDGNKRFVSGHPLNADRDPARRSELAAGQHPFAIVLTCSDSRVPPELVFDQGLGSIFVVRVAGNTADDVAIGSIEYAVEHLGARLIVVLGHEKCGAVAAAVKGGELPGHLPAVVADIRPLVAQAKADPGDPVHNCVWLNAAHVAAQLRASGPILSEFVEHHGVEVQGAVYDLDSGVVRLVPSRETARAAAGDVRFSAP
ncbi:MAG: carbonic anhydrase [Phycisphaerales bacterium]